MHFGSVKIFSNGSIAASPIVAIAPADEPCTTGSSSVSNASIRFGSAFLFPIIFSVLAEALLMVTLELLFNASHNIGMASSPTEPRLFANVNLNSPLLSPNPATILFMDSRSEFGSSPLLSFCFKAVASSSASSSVRLSLFRASCSD